MRSVSSGTVAEEMREVGLDCESLRELFPEGEVVLVIAVLGLDVAFQDRLGGLGADLSREVAELRIFEARLEVGDIEVGVGVPTEASGRKAVVENVQEPVDGLGEGDQLEAVRQGEFFKVFEQNMPQRGFLAIIKLN
jgi:hypothetical protein